MTHPPMPAPPKPKPHVPPVDEAWLARGTESLIMPPVPIVDSHFHLWDYSDPPYDGAAYARDAAQAGIVQSVFVECSMAYLADGPEELRPAGEVAFAAAEAASGPAVANVIVGAADLRLGEAVGRSLDALIAAGKGRLRGIRVRAAHDDDPAAGYGGNGPPAGILGDPSFRAGAACLAARGLSLDIYAFHTQLDEVAALAAACPDLPIALNHVGAPLGVGRYADQRVKVRDLWRRGMERLAGAPNVRVKIGGFAISRLALIDRAGRDSPPGSDELAEVMRLWFDGCVDMFGADRCMFGSNFPVDKTVMPLTTLVNAMLRLSERLDDAGRAALLAGTAKAFYRIV